MPDFLHSYSSLAHLVASLVAVVAGTILLRLPKGTRRHRQFGWVYVGAMSVLLVTAFQIYALFGRFGIVHWGAVGSGAALLVGVGALLARAVVPAWRRWHYAGMSVSVTGLYAALVVESTYRLFPAGWFWDGTLGLAGLVFLGGGWLVYRYYPVLPSRL